MLQNERVDPNILMESTFSVFQMAVLCKNVDMVSCMHHNERVEPNLLTSTEEHVLKLTNNQEILQLLLENGSVTPPITE
jgi:hypothetical protein